MAKSPQKPTLACINRLRNGTERNPVLNGIPTIEKVTQYVKVYSLKSTYSVQIKISIRVPGSLNPERIVSRLRMSTGILRKTKMRYLSNEKAERLTQHESQAHWLLLFLFSHWSADSTCGVVCTINMLVRPKLEYGSIARSPLEGN